MSTCCCSQQKLAPCPQVQYSLLSRGPAQEEVRASCRDLGIQMIAYSPLALGMLVGECTELA